MAHLHDNDYYNIHNSHHVVDRRRGLFSKREHSEDYIRKHDHSHKNQQHGKLFQVFHRNSHGHVNYDFPDPKYHVNETQQFYPDGTHAVQKEYYLRSSQQSNERIAPDYVRFDVYDDRNQPLLTNKNTHSQQNYHIDDDVSFEAPYGHGYSENSQYASHNQSYSNGYDDFHPRNDSGRNDVTRNTHISNPPSYANNNNHPSSSHHRFHFGHRKHNGDIQISSPYNLHRNEQPSIYDGVYPHNDSGRVDTGYGYGNRHANTNTDNHVKHDERYDTHKGYDSGYYKDMDRGVSSKWGSR